MHIMVEGIRSPIGAADRVSPCSPGPHLSAGDDGICPLVVSAQAQGSLIDQNGTVIGSRGSPRCQDRNISMAGRPAYDGA